MDAGAFMIKPSPRRKSGPSPIRLWIPAFAGTTTFAAALLVLPGCFLAPHYKRPAIETPPAYKEAASAVMPQTATPVSSSTGTATAAGNVQWKMANPKDTLAHGPWWQMFGDPQLNQLEQQVLVSNQNIKQAEAQYRQARAFVSEVRVRLPADGRDGPFHHPQLRPEQHREQQFQQRDEKPI